MRPAKLKHAGHGLLAAMVVFLALFSFLRVSCLLNTAGEGAVTLVVDDRDNDTIDDDHDNCPDHPNVTQADFDNDDRGNRCQYYDECDDSHDTDEDDIPDGIDWCTNEESEKAVINTDCHLLGDIAENLGDHCDNCPLIMNQDQDNADCDDVGDACEDPDIDGTLGVRMVIIAGGDEQAFLGSGIELFDDSTNLWTCFGNLDCSRDGGVSSPNSEGADGPGIAILPGYYRSRLLDAKSCGAIAMIEFNEPLDSRMEGEATAGLVARLVTAGDEDEPKSWLYCGLGRKDGEDVLIIKSRHSDCDTLECMDCEGTECYQGEEIESMVVLPEGFQLTNRNEEEGVPVWYPLQIIRDESKVKCFLRSRLWYNDLEKDVIARVEAPYRGTMDSLIGLRADGVKVTFQAVSLYRF